MKLKVNTITMNKPEGFGIMLLTILISPYPLLYSTIVYPVLKLIEGKDLNKVELDLLK